jgi:quinol monooxygenase YgiN
MMLVTYTTDREESNMSIGVIVDFQFKEDTNGAALMTEVLKERLPSVTRSYDGCEFVNLYADPDDANHLVLMERWESRAKYEKYREWAMAQQGSSEAMAFLERDPTWMYLDDTGA